jgi:hypothetical protein
VHMSTWDKFTEVAFKTPEGSQELSSQAMEQVRDGAAISCSKSV